MARAGRTSDKNSVRGPLLGMVLTNGLNQIGQVIRGFGAAHHPVPDGIILAGEQSIEGFLINDRSALVGRLEPGGEQHVQLSHTASAAPAKARELGSWKAVVHQVRRRGGPASSS